MPIPPPASPKPHTAERWCSSGLDRSAPTVLLQPCVLRSTPRSAPRPFCDCVLRVTASALELDIVCPWLGPPSPGSRLRQEHRDQELVPLCKVIRTLECANKGAIKLLHSVTAASYFNCVGFFALTVTFSSLSSTIGDIGRVSHSLRVCAR